MVDKIRSENGEAIFIKTDITKSEEVKALIDQTLYYFGTIDIAINSAGAEGTPGVKTADFDEQIWDEMLAVNLSGLWYSMKYEIPVMQMAGKGVIVNISSLAGLRAGGAGVGYHAAKFGAVGISKTAAWEYADQNIRINAICPAVIDTPMADRAFNTREKRENAIKMHPVGRLGKVEEVVNLILWLASSEASFVTGTAIPVDGGANL